MFPLLGAGINLSTQSAKAASSSSSFAVMNLDSGNYSQIAIQYFAHLPNTTVKPVPSQTVTSAIQAALKENVSSLVVIPADFSSNIDARKTTTLDTYTVVTSFGVAQAASGGRLTAVVSSFGTYLSSLYVRSASPDLNASVVISPLSLNESTFLNNQLIAASPAYVTGTGLSQSLALPIATFIVIVFSMQIASAAMAVEKEQKTFETLLTLPVSRFQILASKLVGSTVIAAMGAATSIIGFTYYINSINNISGGASPALTISPTLTYYFLLGVLLFLTIALATALAIIVAVFSADVRGAQAVVGYLSFPILLPSIIVIFAGFDSLGLPLQAVLLAIPFSYIAIFSTTGLFGGITYALIGVVYLLAWIVGTLYLASRLFNSERVLTARFSFGSRKKKAPPSD